MNRLAVRGAARLVSLVAFCGACRGARTIADPVPDVPVSQQRAVQRGDFDPGWPFNVERGTLACIDGAVVFRADGVTYGLNEAAWTRRFRAPEPVRQFQSKPPSNPLSRLTQDQRMRIFAESSACPHTTAPAQCRQRLRDGMAVTEAELTQIDAEGAERRWPPLTREHTPLDSILTAGSRLCQPR